jgi:hypothetical protein
MSKRTSVVVCKPKSYCKIKDCYAHGNDEVKKKIESGEKLVCDENRCTPGNYCKKGRKRLTKVQLNRANTKTKRKKRKPKKKAT